ncbi:MAG TPA: hypothetical protein VK009_25575 [Chloroflexota bacterium]|nr:hypothetical protein [Chloroflexota bacterium]
MLYDGALMNGQGCAIWDESGPAEWAVWGDTLLSEQSYWVWAWVNGEDSCSGSVFTSDMTSSGSATNASSAGTGSWAYGPYLNCIDGNTHVYRIYTQHQRQYTSGSSSEGYSSDVNY